MDKHTIELIYCLKDIHIYNVDTNADGCPYCKKEERARKKKKSKEVR